MAMTFILSQKHDVVALIVDHQLRKESAAEAAKASKILDKLGIENHILSKKHKISSNLQEEARKLRYGLLVDYCKANKIKYLATAHHAEDNAETFLLRLARGSGLDGLSGIAPVSEMDGIKLIRPVLNYSKMELASLLKTNKIKWVEDPTNNTDKYKRNSLRHALELLEEKDLITSRINDAAVNLARVRDFVEIETAKAEKSCLKIEGEKAEIDAKKFAKLHDEIAYRVLANVIVKLAKADKKPRFEKLKRLKSEILDGQTRTLNGLIFETRNEKIIIAIEK